MSAFLTWQALVMFILGFVLSASVKGIASTVRSKAGA